jgi:2-phospho-L-lactate guanylyltransferase
MRTRSEVRSRVRSRVSGVVVPIRSFRFGKARLAAVLDESGRIALGRRMAEAVVTAAGTRPVVVVSGAPEVQAWCRDHGITCIDDPGSLDAAADAGRRWAREQQCARVVVVHGDLPFARTLDHVDDIDDVDDLDDGDGERERDVALFVPDHHEDGTPVCSVPAAAPFVFAYGPGSFRRHVAEARRIGLAVRVVRDDALGFDVDVPEDLARLESPAR